MGMKQRVLEAWDVLRGTADLEAQARDGQGRFTHVDMTRKTAPLPSILTPYRGIGQSNTLPKPTAVNLRKFAETPVARRAINVVKDRIACMDWQVRVRRGYDAAEIPNVTAKLNALRHALEEPNPGDSFRTLIRAGARGRAGGRVRGLRDEGDARCRAAVRAVGRWTGPRCRWMRSGPATPTSRAMASTPGASARMP